MMPTVPRALLAQADDWANLHRWERSELGKALRRRGLSYGEIRELVPVPKGTLSGWCRDIRLSDQQVAAIKRRTPSRRDVPTDTQRKRRRERQRIANEARGTALNHADDPFFVAGVVLYWGEGTKSGNELSLANSDPRISRLFIDWVRSYHDPHAEFVLKLNLHAANDEEQAKSFWSRETGLSDFYKTFIKAEGTGHRKNHLTYGVCLVRMRRGTDAKLRTMSWIDVLAERPRW